MKATFIKECQNYISLTFHSIWKLHGPEEKHRFPKISRDFFSNFGFQPMQFPYRVTYNAEILFWYSLIYVALI
jgi:hypothetical protein